jgi:hypothetical protein
MLNSNSKKHSVTRSRHALAFVGVCAFILLVTAGALALSSCATTPKGLARETQLYLATSNAVSGLSALAPYTPPPIAGLIEGATAVGGALLAVWASHLHRSVRALENGSANGSAAKAAGPPKPPEA